MGTSLAHHTQNYFGYTCEPLRHFCFISWTFSAFGAGWNSHISHPYNNTGLINSSNKSVIKSGFRNMPICDITLGTSDTTLLILTSSACMWACRHVLICADLCWHVPTLSVLVGPIISTLLGADILECAGMCQHLETCRHVPIYDVTLGTFDINHLDLIWMLACVNTCGHADMCWYVPTCAD